MTLLRLKIGSCVRKDSCSKGTHVTVKEDIKTGNQYFNSWTVFHTTHRPVLYMKYIKYIRTYMDNLTYVDTCSSLLLLLCTYIHM